MDIAGLTADIFIFTGFLCFCIGVEGQIKGLKERTNDIENSFCKRSGK